MWKFINVCVVSFSLGISASLVGAQAGETGTETGGMAGFHGVGDFQQFEPDFGVWKGSFGAKVRQIQRPVLCIGAPGIALVRKFSRGVCPSGVAVFAQ